jgi:hypothetical protein
MSSNKQQPEQDDNNDSGLMTLGQFFQELKEDMKSWTPEEKAQARQALMDKYVHNKQN